MDTIWKLLAALCVAATVLADIDVEPELIRCPRQLCEKDCKFGFKTDADGCNTGCECLEDPCMVLMCDEMSLCQRVKCQSNPCTTITAKCIAMPPCPMPMCSNRCEFGYMKSDMGCDTCECNPPAIPALPNGVMPKLCHLKQQILRGVMDQMNQEAEDVMDKIGGLACQDDGSFEPLQCQHDNCWCVDDHGEMLPGSETTGPVKPECVPHITRQVTIRMVMTHTFIDMTPHQDYIKGAITSQMSKWLEIDENYIEVTKITPDSIERTINVEIEVVHDGVTDLAFVSQRFLLTTTHQPHVVDCQGGKMTIKPNTVKIEHVAKPEPRMTTCFFADKFRHHKTVAIVTAVGIVIFVSVVIGIAISSCRKRRSAKAQFKHEKLDHYEENLAYQSDVMGHPDLTDSEKDVKILSINPNDDYSVEIIPSKY